MQHRKRDSFTLSRAENENLFAADFNVWASEVQQRGYECETSCVDQVAVMTENLQIRTDIKALLAGDQTEDLGVQGIAAADCLFQ